MIKKKEPRIAVLYVRISPENRAWVDHMADQLGYSRSEFLDRTLQLLRYKTPPIRKKKRRK